ncbi:MAG: VCBS repeat-containing protein [Candidatus Latescibacterota bacterium]
MNSTRQRRGRQRSGLPDAPATSRPAHLRARLTITSPLPDDLGHIPFSPVVDFGALVEAAGGGALDPNSIAVVDLADGQEVEYARGEDFAHGDRGRLEWVVRDPGHREYEIHFRAVAVRPALPPQARVPLVGAGDLLRYNAGAPRPLTLYSMRLIDLDGDGRAELAGTWNYYHRPGSPVSGVVCYPRLAGGGAPLFGDLTRLRWVEERDAAESQEFPGTYVDADFADVDGDGLPDLVFAERGRGEVTFYLNTGRRQAGGLPLFVRDCTIPVPAFDLGNLSLVDVDGDGILDLVVEGWYVRNANPNGWPFTPAAAVDLGSGPRVVVLDLDGDGRGDLVGLAQPDAAVHHPEESVSYVGYEPFWRQRLPGPQVAFGPTRPLPDLPGLCSRIAAAVDGGQRGLLVQDEALQRIRFLAVEPNAGQPHLVPRWRAESPSAVLSLGDQAWPCVCDWDKDGDWDLLVGGGYGWPRILLNQGSGESPALDEARPILADGRPIRLLRDEILGSRHWHNMGYPYPVFVDWDGDGLPDLVVPNETNRILWYRNVGTRQEPRFGPGEYLQVDGFPDSEALRAESGQLAQDPGLPNHPYPRDERSPFFWRTGAALADWNGDGRMDLITHGWERHATLFVQEVEADGQRHLRLAGPVRLEDGRPIDDSIVGRPMHWTEAFRPVDWDGDGRIDLVYSLAGTGEIYLLRNVGTSQEPVFAVPRRLCCYGQPLSFTVHGPCAWAADLNGDGKPDLLGCVEWSVYPFFAHAALEMPAHPAYRIGPVERAG